MTTQNTMIASQVRKNDVLDPMFPGQLHQHVLNVEWEDDTHQFILITTEVATWRFHWREEVLFPRHQDGRQVQWWHIQIEPTPEELGIGDELPSANEPRPHESDKMALDYWESEAQTVTKIAGHIKEEYVVVYAKSKLEGVTRRWPCRRNFPIAFPRAKDYVTELDQIRPRGTLMSFGPYVIDRYPGTIYHFYAHPFGKGRWPSDVDVYTTRVEEGTFYSRPPRTRPEWRRLMLVNGGTPHPNDPYHAKLG